jgi:hypothetical protein
MSKNPPTPLSPREREALDRLAPWFDGRDDPKAREVVIDHLTAGDFEHDEAQRVLDRLLSKGYMYEHNRIRITDPE